MRRRTTRGEQTRQQIIAASIVCLNRLGYAGTSVENVMDEARLSRGSVLNQFPNRIALMAGVIEASLDSLMMETNRRANRIADPQARLRGIVDVFWESQKLPAATVVTEVLLAARWDEALATALRPVGEQIYQQFVIYVLELLREADVREANFEEGLAHAYLLILSLRGIALELMHNPGADVVYRALDQIKSMHQAHCDKVLEGR